MKKIGKKLSAILFVALCCVLLFPITAMAEEIIEEPIALPETMTITKQLFSDSGELEPEKITIKSHEDGRFYFEYPANTVSDMRGYGDNHSYGHAGGAPLFVQLASGNLRPRAHFNDAV